jgi:succinate dehydrogenase/fumarate reductase flavoprotein subunit
VAVDKSPVYLKTLEEPKFPNHFPFEQLEELCSGKQFDLVVVGCGGAGAAAAIEAAELGASVIILEKTQSIGGSTQESGGTIRTLNDRAGAIAHYMWLAEGTTPQDVIEAYVDGVMAIPDWVNNHGGELVLGENSTERGESNMEISRWVFPARLLGSAFPHLPGADAIGARGHVRGRFPGRDRGADGLVDFLAANLARLQVPVVLGARVKRLIQDFPARRVTGVEVEGGAEIQASKGVVLSCGGFAWDAELKRQYLGFAMPALSPPNRNTGDGVRMALDVGADLWHMTGTATTVAYQFPELDAAIHCRIPGFGFVMVDQRGRRYACETDIENHAAALTMLFQDSVSGEYLRSPSFVIFDETTRRAGVLAQTTSGENRRYEWSADNEAEIQRGWIRRAGTLNDLCAYFKLPADTLRQTIDDFNRCAESGGDPFGRRQDKMRRIATPPYYGAAVYPALLNTQGGPRRNAKGEILRPDGSPIPGLFGAGECGSVWNRLYPGAGNVSETIASGRLAARAAMSAG